MLLSLGTGFSPHRITADTSRWGAVQWAFHPSPPLPLLLVMLDGVVEADTHFSSQLLGRRYFRLNPLLPETIALDANRKIPDLVALAENADLGPVSAWIRRYWF